jgi:PPOX class probable F420-dependent enzyme
VALPATTSLPAHVRRFLGTPRYAVVATVDEDGAPRQAVVWFLLEGDTIVVNSREGRRWPTNLRREPRISIAVTDATTESWVGLSGKVEIVDDQERAHADIAAMARRYHADPAAAEQAIAEFKPQRRVSFRLRATSIHDHIEGD